jgi:hypothetical protein
VQTLRKKKKKEKKKLTINTETKFFSMQTQHIHAKDIEIKLTKPHDDLFGY